MPTVCGQWGIEPWTSHTWSSFLGDFQSGVGVGGRKQLNEVISESYKCYANKTGDGAEKDHGGAAFHGRGQVTNILQKWLLNREPGGEKGPAL